MTKNFDMPLEPLFLFFCFDYLLVLKLLYVVDYSISAEVNIAQRSKAGDYGHIIPKGNSKTEKLESSVLDLARN